MVARSHAAPRAPAVGRTLAGAPRSGVRRLSLAALACCAGGWLSLAAAQVVPEPRPVGPPQRSVAEWLIRLQQAARVPSYVGTFVVSLSSGAMASARIWHVCEGDVQLERVESLTGPQRSTFRRNEAVVTFLPDARLVKLDQRESGGTFPSLLSGSQGTATAEYYTAHEQGQGRVAGFDADIVWLRPRDQWRFGYRIWSEKRTGLVLKTQILDASTRVLEQSAFSELQLDAPVQAERLRQMMASTEGYRVVKAERARTSADAEGWRVRLDAPGFQPQSCYRRPLTPGTSMLQCVYSDGIATVSVFMQPFDAERHPHEGVSVLGATYTLMRRLAHPGGDWWITAVGEVPPSTLKAFAQAFERRP